MKPIRDMQIKGQNIEGITQQLFDCGGFTAKKFSQGVDILEMMQKDDCVKFLSFPACIVATGVRGVIRDLIKDKMFDVIVTTTGTLDHDLARIWRDYSHGDFLMNDRELHKKGINRLGNVLIPNESYGEILEEKLQPLFEGVYKDGKEISGYEMIWKIGEFIENEEEAKDSIIYWAWKNNIPVFVPGFFDGAFGSQVWLFWQNHRDFRINLLKDEQKLSDIVFDSERTGALIIGGGISKHHTLWWNQFKDGLDYAVYITTAQEYDGSLSGARLREAISWGKVGEMAKQVTIEGEATLVLPFMIWAFYERMER